MMSVDHLNEAGRRLLPVRLGMYVLDVVGGVTPAITVRMPLRRHHLAPHGFVHGGAIAALADSACGYGCWVGLPPHANGFLTIESTANHLGAAKRGELECTAYARHVGRSTQVWDADIVEVASGRRVAMFRCTQLILKTPHPAAEPTGASA